jgi:hypothetical protein
VRSFFRHLPLPRCRYDNSVDGWCSVPRVGVRGLGRSLSQPAQLALARDVAAVCATLPPAEPCAWTFLTWLGERGAGTGTTSGNDGADGEPEGLPAASSPTSPKVRCGCLVSPCGRSRGLQSVKGACACVLDVGLLGCVWGGGGSGGRGWPPRHSVVCVLAIQQSPGGLERQWLLFIGFYTRSIIDSFCSTADAMGLTGFLMSGKVWQAVAVCEGLCVCAGVTPCEGKGWAKCACGFFIRIPACDAHAGLHRESDCAA